MANKKTYSKRQKDIKSKLMAAVCMLLVSSIMMVSSTYAWFTLSTAPEVTGITTQVGANGNLEMALLPVDAITKGQQLDYGITSNLRDSAKAQDERNITWGNLVDLGLYETNYYGLDKITLYPSQLNIENGATQLPETILATPGYGADGRVSELLTNTVTGIYDGQGSFPEAAGSYGVRAVGTASGMTDRQLAYRNARSAANTAMSQAKNTASGSLNTNGAALASIAIAAKLSEAPNTQADIASLQAILCDLLGYSFVSASEGATHYQVEKEITIKDSAGNTQNVTRYAYHTAGDGTPAATHKIAKSGKGVLDLIESAYKNYIVAYVASAAGQTAGVTDENFTAFQNLVDGMTVYDMLNDQYVGKILGDVSVSGPLGDLQSTRSTVENVFDELDALTGEEIDWETKLYPTMSKMVKTEAITVGGMTTSEIMQDPMKLASQMSDLKVTIASGGGVYADIADHCGTYNASIQLVLSGIEYSGLKLDGTFPARMEAKCETAATLTLIGAAVEAAKSPDGAGAGDMPITDMYGYIIDLGFRTNAAESNLLLQTDAADRIYSDNAEDAETRGHGSTMTFISTPSDFSVDQLKSLMGAIRVVFFETDTRNILANAKLDMTEGNLEVVGGNTVTAKLYLYEQTGATTKDVYTLDNENGTYKLVDGAYVEIGDDPDFAGEKYKKETQTVAAGEQLLTNKNDAVITALNQNAAKPVSVLVYLDGNNITNASVGATAATSMTGTMNLQFASSANLEPMSYTPLQVQGTNNNQSGDAGAEG